MLSEPLCVSAVFGVCIGSPYFGELPFISGNFHMAGRRCRRVALNLTPSTCGQGFVVGDRPAHIPELHAGHKMVVGMLKQTT